MNGRYTHSIADAAAATSERQDVMLRIGRVAVDHEILLSPPPPPNSTINPLLHCLPYLVFFLYLFLSPYILFSSNIVSCLILRDKWHKRICISNSFWPFFPLRRVVRRFKPKDRAAYAVIVRRMPWVRLHSTLLSHRTVEYSTVQYSTVQYSTISYSTVLKDSMWSVQRIRLKDVLMRM